MNTEDHGTELGRNDVDSNRHPFVSLVVPVYNEAAIVAGHLTTLCQYLESLEGDYRWEILCINDGSTDGTGALVEALARSRDNLRVFHQPTNLGIGMAFQRAFEQCRGDYVVTLDLDLSYSPDHIQRLLAEIRETAAAIVLASPYMEGGIVSDVPWLRRLLSLGANRFLSVAARGAASTLTCMVRAYDRRFLRAIELTSRGPEVNVEILYKALLVRAAIAEIPAHLHWPRGNNRRLNPGSGQRMLRYSIRILRFGWLFWIMNRPAALAHHEG